MIFWGLFFKQNADIGQKGHSWMDTRRLSENSDFFSNRGIRKKLPQAYGWYPEDNFLSMPKSWGKRAFSDSLLVNLTVQFISIVPIQLPPIRLIFTKKNLTIQVKLSNSHFENICKGSRRRFFLRCNQYFFHRSLNAPKPVVLSLSKACPPSRAAQARRAGGKGDRFNCGPLLGLSGDEL